MAALVSPTAVAQKEQESLLRTHTRLLRDHNQLLEDQVRELQLQLGTSVEELQLAKAVGDNLHTLAASQRRPSPASLRPPPSAAETEAEQRVRLQSRNEELTRHVRELKHELEEGSSVNQQTEKQLRREVDELRRQNEKLNARLEKALQETGEAAALQEAERAGAQRALGELVQLRQQRRVVDEDNEELRQQLSQFKDKLRAANERNDRLTHMQHSPASARSRSASPRPPPPSEAEEQLRARNEELRRELREVRKESESREAQLKAREQAARELEHALERAALEHTSLAGQLADAREEAKGGRATAEERARLAQLTAELTDAQRWQQILEKENAHLQQRLSHTKSKLQEANQKIETLLQPSPRRSPMRDASPNASPRGEDDPLRRRNDELIRELRRMHELLEAEQEAHRRQVQEAEQHRARADDANGTLAAQVETLERQLGDAVGRLRVLEDPEREARQRERELHAELERTGMLRENQQLQDQLHHVQERLRQANERNDQLCVPPARDPARLPTERVVAPVEPTQRRCDELAAEIQSLKQQLQQHREESSARLGKELAQSRLLHDENDDLRQQVYKLGQQLAQAADEARQAIQPLQLAQRTSEVQLRELEVERTVAEKERARLQEQLNRTQRQLQETLKRNDEFFRGTAKRDGDRAPSSGRAHNPAPGSPSEELHRRNDELGREVVSLREKLHQATEEGKQQQKRAEWERSQLHAQLHEAKAEQRQLLQQLSQLQSPSQAVVDMDTLREIQTELTETQLRNRVLNRDLQQLQEQLQQAQRQLQSAHKRNEELCRIAKAQPGKRGSDAGDEFPSRKDDLVRELAQAKERARLAEERARMVQDQYNTALLELGSLRSPSPVFAPPATPPSTEVLRLQEDKRHLERRAEELRATIAQMQQQIREADTTAQDSVQRKAPPSSSPPSSVTRSWTSPQREKPPHRPEPVRPRQSSRHAEQERRELEDQLAQVYTQFVETHRKNDDLSRALPPTKEAAELRRRNGDLAWDLAQVWEFLNDYEASRKGLLPDEPRTGEQQEKRCRQLREMLLPAQERLHQARSVHSELTAIARDHARSAAKSGRAAR